MTKKYWFDWQKRVDETKGIFVKHKNLLTTRDDKLKTINFDNDKDEVEFVIERDYERIWGWEPIKISFYYKFKRIDILTVQFN